MMTTRSLRLLSHPQLPKLLQCRDFPPSAKIRRSPAPENGQPGNTGCSSGSRAGRAKSHDCLGRTQSNAAMREFYCGEAAHLHCNLRAKAWVVVEDRKSVV